MAKRLPTFLRGDLAEDDGAVGVEAEAHHRAAGLLVEAGLGVGQHFAAELDVLVEQLLAAILCSATISVAGRNALRLGLLRRHRRVDEVEGQARGLGRSVSLRRAESSKPGTCTSTRSAPWRWIVGSVVPTSSMRLRMTSIDCAISDDIRSLMPCVGQLDGELAVRRLAELELLRAAEAEHAVAGLQLLQRRLRRRLLRRIGQLDREPVGVGGDDVADAVLAGEDLPGVAAQRLQPLGDHRVAVDLQQQVRAALQVEAERHAV